MRRTGMLAVAAAVAGSLVLAVPASASNGNSREENKALLIAAGFFLLLTAVLYVVKTRRTVANKALAGIEVGEVKRTFAKGAIVDDATATAIAGGMVTGVGPTAIREKKFSLLHYLLVGKDNRTSTSKVVVFAWTYAIAYGLLTMLVAKWLGDSGAWGAQVYGKDVQEEYLVFLGGPYAAAIYVKYRNVTGGAAKTQAPVADSATEGAAGAVKQVVADDRGEADLIDFQYVLFNALALAYFLGTLIPELDAGFPEMPELLAGLALTSAGGYSAKKLVAQERPRLVSVFPSTLTARAPGAPDAPHVDIWARNLVVAGAEGQEPVRPIVTIGAKEADIESIDATLGTERIRVKLPPGLEAKEHPVRALRADGVPATTESGTDFLPLTITPPAPAQQR